MQLDVGGNGLVHTTLALFCLLNFPCHSSSVARRMGRASIVASQFRLESFLNIEMKEGFLWRLVAVLGMSSGTIHGAWGYCQHTPGSVGVSPFVFCDLRLT